MRIKTVKIPIYFGCLRIVIAKDFKKAALKLKVNTEGLDGSKYSAFVCPDRKNRKAVAYSYLVFLKPKTSPAVIAHEAVHLVNSVFIDSGIQLDRHNDEPQAYLTGWFTEQIFKALR